MKYKPSFHKKTVKKFLKIIFCFLVIFSLELQGSLPYVLAQEVSGSDQTSTPTPAPTKEATPTLKPTTTPSANTPTPSTQTPAPNTPAPNTPTPSLTPQNTPETATLSPQTASTALTPDATISITPSLSKTLAPTFETAKPSPAPQKTKEITNKIELRKTNLLGKIDQKKVRAEINFKDNKIKNFKISEKPEFEISLSDSKFTNKLKLGTDNFKKSVSAVIKYEGLKDEKLSVDLNIDSNKNLLVSPKNKNISRPGKYHLSLKIPTDSGEEIIEQDFTWGVLAINTNKSIYLPGDKAYIQMGSLDNLGHTLCESNLKLEITDPQGNKTLPDVTPSSTCDQNNVTDNPDYFSYYQVGQTIGTYNINLTNNDNNYSISDSFEVKASVPFVVERIGATRINPFKSDYKMTIKILANQDFDGQIIEQIPLTYGVTDKQGATITTNPDFKNLTWNIKLASGEEKTIWYEYDPEEISPYLFNLGPLRIVEKNSAQDLFTEGRQWQIASDLTCNSAGDLNWNAAASWSCGRVPQNIDDVYILTTHTITVNMSGAVAQSLTINSPGANNSTNGLAITTGNSLTVSNNLNYVANSSSSNENQFITFAGTASLSVGGNFAIPAPTANSQSIFTCNSGATGTLNVTGSISITSGASSGRLATMTGLTCTISAAGINITGGTSVAATINSTTGTITTTNGITFGGDAARAALTTTGAGTINLAGTMSAGGTLAINAGTTLYTTSTSAINGAYTLGNLTVSSGATTLGAAILVANILTVVTGTLTVGANNLTAGSVKVASGATISQTSGITEISVGTNKCIGANSSDCSGTPGTIGFYNLSINDAVSGNPVILNGTSTVTVGGNLTIKGGTIPGDPGALTINGTSPTVTVVGNLDIQKADAGGILSAAGTINVGGNFTNSGTFTANSSEVVLNGSGTQILSGATTFYKLTVSNAGGRTITFPSSTTTTISNTLALSGTSCDSKLTLAPSTPSTVWTLTAPAGTTVTYISVSYSTSTNAITANSSFDGGSNNANWTINACGDTIQGSIYQADESTPDTTTYTIAVSVNNAAPQTQETSTGSYSIGISSSAGDKLAIYIQGHDNNANTFTITGGESLSSIHLFVGKVGITGGAGAPTNSDICVTFTTYPGADALFSCSGNNITITGTELHQFGNYFPGADVTTSKFHLKSGTYTGGSETLTISGTGQTTSRPFYIDGGTFTPTSNTTTFTGGSTSDLQNTTYYNLTINGTGPFNAMGTTSVSQQLLISSGTLAMGTNTLNVGSETASANGYIKVASGAIISQSTSATTNIKNGSGGSSCVGGTTDNACSGPSGTISFGTLTTAMNTGITTVNGTSPTVTVSNILSIAPISIFRLNATTTLILSGSGTPLSLGGTYDTTTNPGSTTKYTSPSGVTSLGTGTFHHLEIAGSGTFNTGGSPSVNGNLTVTTGTLAMGANNLTVGSTAASGNGYIKVASNGTISQSSAGTTTIQHGSGGASCIGAADDNSCTGSPGTIGFYNLTIGNSSLTTIGGTSPTITVGNTLTINTGATFRPNATTTIVIQGTTPILRTGTFDATTNSGSTVKLTSTTGATAISDATMTTTNAFWNLEINRTSQTFIMGAAIDVKGNLTITAGTLDTKSGSNYTLQVAGNWTNSVGAGGFTANSGTVTLNATAADSEQQISGNTTFYNLTATSTVNRYITFASASTTTIAAAGTFTATGTSCSALLYLRDSGSTWNLTFTDGTPLYSTNYVHVTNSNSNRALTAANGTDGGGNTNWTITSACGGGPTTDQQMRHGNWFNNGTEQYFTF